ncbi:hypothetical protein [Moraxella bovis]|nr:hypothetical protein [Moraxella bovis]
MVNPSFNIGQIAICPWGVLNIGICNENHEKSPVFQGKSEV